MPSAEDPSFFTSDIGTRIESGAAEARAAGRRVNALTAAWYLFLGPMGLFVYHMVPRGKLFAGFGGFRESVHVAAFYFAVNARIYELSHADPAELDKIKKEFG